MAGVSDIIPTLSITTPLAASTSYTTEKYIAGQYVSLSITVFSDEDTQVLVQFSPDGVNWDVGITKNFIANTKGNESLVIQSKWVRYKITNISITNQTILRVYTYGSTTNSSVEVLLSKIGAKSPTVSIDNAPRESFGTPLTSKITAFPSTQYNFGYLGNVNNPVAISSVQKSYTPYRYTFGATSLGASYYSSQDNLISLCGFGGGSGTAGRFSSITADDIVPYRAGQCIISRFTAVFDSTLNQYDLKIGMGYKIDKTAEPIESGTFIGLNSNLELYIAYVNNGVETKVSQPNFNWDRLDGTGNSGYLLNPGKLNIYQIKYGYLGVADIQYQIMTTDGTWTTFHVVRSANKVETSHLSYPGGSFILQMKKLTDDDHTADFNYKVACASYGGFICDDLSFSQGYSYSNSLALTTTNETKVVLLRNKESWVVGRHRPVPVVNRRLFYSSFLTGGGASSNNKITYRVYFNPTYSVNPTETPFLQHKTPVYTLSGETITDNGTRIYQFDSLLGIDRSQTYNDRFVWPAGYDLLITAQAVVTNHTTNITIDWDQYT